MVSGSSLFEELVQVHRVVTGLRSMGKPHPVGFSSSGFRCGSWV